MDIYARFKDSIHSKSYSDEMLAERRWNKKYLTFIFMTCSLYYIVDIILSNFVLNDPQISISEIIVVLSLLCARMLGYFLYFKYEKYSISNAFKVFEFLFVILFCLTSIITWNAQINMDIQRAYIVGLDAGWVLRYILVLFDQFKFRAFIDVSIMIFGIAKLILMSKAFNMSYVQAGFQILYILLLLYSKERVQKIKFLRTFSLKRTEQTLKIILNNIPENIAVLNTSGDLIYYNDYLDICFNITEESGEDIDLFSKFFSVKPRERYKVFSPESFTDAEKNSIKPTKGKMMRKMLSRKLTFTTTQNSNPRVVPPNPHLKAEDEFTSKKQDALNMSNLEKSGLSDSKNIKDSHASLTEALTFIEHFSTLQEVIDFFVRNLPAMRTYSNKENNFFIFDAKFRHDEDSPVKYYEIKISLASFEGEESFVVILRDTTHRDIIVTLENNNNFKDSVISSISHELRTPLNTILNMLDYSIKESGIPKELAEEFLVPAHQSGKLLQSLIHDILDYSLHLAGKLDITKKSKSLANTLDKVKYIIEDQAKKKNLFFSIVVSPRVNRQITTDHKRLRQILVTLLSNSLKFTNHGYITLSVDPWGFENRIIKFSVEDTGIGMTDQEVDKISNVLKKNKFTGKLSKSSAGIGMGLMTSQLLVKKLNPKITKLSGLKLESRYEEGSTFWFFVDTKADTPPSNSPISLQADTSQILRQCTSPGIANELRARLLPSQGTQGTIDFKEEDHVSINMETSSSQVKFIEPRRPASRLATLEQKRKLNEETNQDFMTYPSDTLGDKEQQEEQLACLSKDHNFNLSKQVSDNLQPESHKFLHPKFITKVSVSTGSPDSLSGKPSQDEGKENKNQEKSCDCPKILVADDDVFNLFTMQNMMKTFGLTIAQAHNGQEAVKIALKRAINKCSPDCQFFKLVLMDLSMPVMDGFEATIKLKEMMLVHEIPPVPIIACTAFVDTDKTEKCFQCGMEGRISKPVSKNKVKEILKNYKIPIKA